MDRSYIGTISFSINRGFKIVKIYKNVKPETHTKEVLNDLKLFLKTLK
jgi:peroxiredoxin